jgi:hypothetical protein
MQEVTYVDESIRVGDEVADVLLDYATVLADEGRSDHVTLQVITRDGSMRQAKILLNGGSNLLSKDADDTRDEPDNAEAIAYMRERMSILARGNLAPVTDFQSFHAGDDTRF